eukprot:scaffold11275_cov15-Tisochrysis_lutea.AAC.3
MRTSAEHFSSHFLNGQYDETTKQLGVFGGQEDLESSSGCKVRARAFSLAAGWLALRDERGRACALTLGPRTGGRLGVVLAPHLAKYCRHEHAESDEQHRIHIECSS